MESNASYAFELLLLAEETAGFQKDRYFVEQGLV